jgi:lysyl-tRNA synthetase
MAMDDTNSLIEQRKAKLAALRAKGIDPFKNKFTPAESCASARAAYVEGREVALAGRITAHRDMGKSMFLDIRDQSGRIQIYAQKNVLGDEQFDIFRHLDLADFIGVNGTMFTTKTGEISVKMTSFVILAKALRPPPAKYYGLEDTETRYRQRYLDLIANPDVKDVMIKRSAIVHEIRQFFHSRDYVEVETPAMQAIPGGAAAQPFKTFHNALGCEFYLRIALELYHKRLLVGGIDKLFEIGKNFRNEGLSRRHNPEFTMLEAYQAFGDYETMMETVEEMVKYVSLTVLKTLLIEHPLKRRFKTELRETVLKLQNLRAKLAEDFKNAPPTSDQLTESYLDFEQVFSDTINELDALASPDNETSFNQAADRALHAFAQCVVLADSFRLTPGMAVEKFDDYTTEFMALISGVTPRFHNMKQEAAVIPAESLNKVINLKPAWRRAKYKDLVREKTGTDWFDISPAERRQRAHDLGAEIGREYEDFEVTGAVFEKLIEPTLINPTFVTHVPKELVPLAKLSPDDPTTVEVFECCINGQEISPGYTEQNDPIQQRTTLEHQAGGEQQKLDEDFLVALEHGMPPAGGIGIGIDRLCMMLLGQESIRDVILFPQLKPK